MLQLSEFVRQPKNTVETYLLEPNETESYLLKKLHTYALRAKTKVSHRVAVVVFLDDDTVRRMVICKIVRPGRKLKRRGRKHAS